MHDIEPHFQWRDFYIAAEDGRSPFFGRKYSEFHFTHKLYNFYLHPQWDYFGSNTLYMKLLFADYDENFALLELIGEWNDTLHNDIMFLKRNVADRLFDKGITRFVFFCDNLLNFHGTLEDDYYAEWAEELRDERGWAALVNLRQHVDEEMHDSGLHRHLRFGEEFNNLNWRPHKPALIFQVVETIVHSGQKRLDFSFR